jgi:hypothetical protein
MLLSWHCLHFRALSSFCPPLHLAKLHVAAPRAKYPNQWTKPVRAYDEEQHAVGPSPWLWLLSKEPWCPTAHGPRIPSQCWLPVAEVLRRFRPVRSQEEVLLPTVVAKSVHVARAHPQFPSTLGIRTDLNPSTFEVRDCIAVFNRVADLYHDISHTVASNALREVVNPTYRHLIELMPPVRDERATEQTHNWHAATSELGQAPLLCHNGSGEFRFQRAAESLHASRRDTRQRIGFGADLWTFVLEGHPAATAPLREFLQVQVLEDVIEGVPQIIPSDLSLGEIERILSEIRAAAPFLLCRLETDRAAERLIQQDTANLRRVLDGLEIVASCSVDYSLPGVEGTKQSTREYFWQESKQDAPAHLFVRWGERVWPPDDDAAEALAAGICEALKVTAFEPLLALIQAPNGNVRRRLLARASAPCEDEHLEEKRFQLAADVADRRIKEDQAGGSLPELPPTAPPGNIADLVTPGGSGETNSDEKPKHPLWDPDCLSFDGEGVLVTGDGGGHQAATTGTSGQAGQGSGGAGRGKIRTDLDDLNRAGMRLAMRYELMRVTEYAKDAAVFDPGDPATFGTAAVFDVSTPEVIAEARRLCPCFQKAIDELTGSHGLSAAFPGFDILTLRPDAHGTPAFDLIDRMIELKSSGVRAQRQEMTWNEWKTAKGTTEFSVAPSR